MVSKIILLSAIAAYVEARFGQEQVPIQAISAVQGGSPGAAATIAGGAISDLLGAANSCAKLATADKIVAQLGGGADAIAAAIGMVTAEKNTNPFANGNVQNVCGDASLPATAELRGITPLIDPAVDTDGSVAALSKQTAASPVSADGKSVFDLLNDAGFGSLVKSQAADGSVAAGNATAGNSNASSGSQSSSSSNQNANSGSSTNASTGSASAAADNSGAACAAGTSAAAGTAATATAAAGSTATGAASGSSSSSSSSSSSTSASGNSTSSAGSILTGSEDFGSCTPTLIFEAGQNGRKATEFTFQIADKTARGGQQEALNPNIITNALCNQLTNVCGANAAAVSTCQQAKQLVSDAGTKNKSTADLFNTALGFAGFVTNPDGGPADVTDVSGATSKRTITRRFKA